MRAGRCESARVPPLARTEPARRLTGFPTQRAAAPRWRSGVSASRAGGSGWPNGIRSGRRPRKPPSPPDPGRDRSRVARGSPRTRAEPGRGGKAARISRRRSAGRIEDARSSGIPLVQIARLLAVVGLELSARAYPAGPPIRDAAHLALLDRLRGRVAPSIAWRFEVPLGRAGDQRAWDAGVAGRHGEIAVEAETRPRDCRPCSGACRRNVRDDPGVSAVVLLLANTRHNRNLLREHGEALRRTGSAGPEILTALAEGRVPGGAGSS